MKTTMSSTDSTSKQDYHITSLGSFERLNSTNYIQWRINARTMLATMKAWEIVTGEEKIPTEASSPLDEGEKRRIGLPSRKGRMSSKSPGIRSALAKREVPWWQMVIMPNNPLFFGRI
jgi:hypothetical protein